MWAPEVSIRGQILNRLKGLQGRLGLAYVMIAHDLAAARYLSTRLAVMYAGRLVEAGECDAVYTSPLHPYTKALLRCLPDVDLKRQRLVEIGGQPPDLTRLPPGCPFAPRCSRREEVCEREYPHAVEVETGHTARCWVAPA